jgi:hypothetical protein
MKNATNEKHNDAWELFRLMIRAKEIEYTDFGKSERYKIVFENGNYITLVSGGNSSDGSYINLE